MNETKFRASIANNCFLEVAPKAVVAKMGENEKNPSFGISALESSLCLHSMQKPFVGWYVEKVPVNLMVGMLSLLSVFAPDDPLF